MFKIFKFFINIRNITVKCLLNFANFGILLIKQNLNRWCLLRGHGLRAAKKTRFLQSTFLFGAG